MAEKLEFVIGAKENFKGVFGKLNTSLKTLTKVAVGTGVAIAGISTALFVMTKTVAKTSDEIGKFSGRIGVSVKALSAYQHIADLSGISTAALNVGWQRMTRRIAEASVGMGVAVGALNELRIPLDAITDLEPDKQFELIAEALSGVANQGDKVRLAMQFWDTEGVSLLQTIEGGTAGLKEMKEEAERLGLVITESGAKKAAEFNDSLTKVQGSLKGLQLTLANDLMPVFTTVFTNISKLVSDNRDKIVSVVREVSIKIAEQAATLLIGTAKLADTIAPVIRSVKNRLVEIFDTFSGLPSWVLEVGLVGAILGGKKGLLIIGGLTALVSSLEKVWKSSEVTTKRVATIDKQLATLQERFEAAGSGGERFARKLAEIGGQNLAHNLQQQMRTLKEMRDVLTGVSSDIETGASLGDILNTDDTNTTVENIGTIESAMTEFLDNIRSLFDEEDVKFNFFDEESTQGTIANIDIIQEKIFAWKESIVDIQETIGDLITGTFDLVSAGVGMAVADVIFEGANLGKALGNLMKQIGKNIVSTLVQVGIQRLILQVLNLSTGITETTARMAQLTAQTYAGAFAATAAIPIIGPSLAPGVAAASTAAMLAGSTAAGATGAGVGATIGIAHGGLTSVPSESTFLLDRGERVLSPNQNEDLTSFLAGGGGGTITIENLILQILPNATNVDAMLSMTRDDWRTIAEENILPAFTTLRTEGAII